MRLVLVRHAETEANAEGRMQGHADFRLSAEGRAQAERLYERFQAEGFEPTHVFASPLLRAFETAEIVARSWPVPVTPWDDLKEHDIGVLAGLTWDEAVERFPDVDMELVRSRQLAGIDGAEPLAARRTRGRRVIETTLGRHSQQDSVLLVSHGGILQHILAALMSAGRTWGVEISNTALFDFRVDLERWHLDGDSTADTSIARIDRFNDAAHLQTP